jgi:hypothetical protein
MRTCKREKKKKFNKRRKILIDKRVGREMYKQKEKRGRDSEEIYLACMVNVSERCEVGECT